ncbi:unnamed protein product [Closterium sp. NIES-54]
MYPLWTAQDSTGQHRPCTTIGGSGGTGTSGGSGGSGGGGEAAEGVAAVQAVGLVVAGLDLGMEALVVISVGARPSRPSSSVSGWFSVGRVGCVPPDPGIAVAALGASASGTPPGTARAEALHTFTLDYGASRCFFRDSTTLTPLSAPVPVRPADPSRGPVVASSSIVLPCPADAMVTTTTPGGQCVSICTCTRTGRHLATFTCRPGSSMYTLTTGPPQVAASAQVSASGQVATSCSCRLQSHQTLLWHHRLGHPSLPHLCGRHSRFLVSGLPRSLPPLPPSPAPPRLPCVEGRQRAAPHSSFPPTTPLLQTLHMDSVSSSASTAVRTFLSYVCTLIEVTSPTLRWTGKVGDASVFRVWGSRAFVRDTSAGKLSARAIPCFFLGFVPDTPGWQFYHPTLCRVLLPQDVTFDESVPFYRLFPYRSAPPRPPPLFLAPGPPLVPLSQQVLGVPSSTGLPPPFLCPLPDPSQLPLQPASPLPAPSPYTEQYGSLTEHREPASHPVSPVRTTRRAPRSRPPPVPGTHAMAIRPSSFPLRVPLPAPPESSLPKVPDPTSDCARAARPTVSRLLATAVTNPSFEFAAASALDAELLDFAAACRLDNATALVTKSASASPPSIGGECALGTDVLEDRQEDFECLATALPRFAFMLLAPEGDANAPDIATPRSYAEAIMGPYSSQWQATMDTEMASWKSTATYVDEVPPLG